MYARKSEIRSRCVADIPPFLRQFDPILKLLLIRQSPLAVRRPGVTARIPGTALG